MGTIKGILGCALALKKHIGGNSCGEIAALRSLCLQKIFLPCAMGKKFSIGVALSRAENNFLG